MKAITLSFGAADTVKSDTITDVGAKKQTQEIKVTIPNFTNSVTGTFEILDSAGNSRYNIPGLPKNAFTLLLVERVICNGYSFKVTLSGAPGSAGDVVIATELK